MSQVCLQSACTVPAKAKNAMLILKFVKAKLKNVLDACKLGKIFVKTTELSSPRIESECNSYVFR